MILDQISNARLYYPLHPGIRRAFEYIDQIDTAVLPAGRYEIEGDMYALVQEYQTKLKEQGFWEAHRRYTDLQYVVQGAECMGYANIHHLRAGEYDPARDFLPLDGTGDVFTLQAGCFVLLNPEDAHMPGLAIGSPAPARKIVVKIPVNWE
ncbi:MAG: YhcH/YjgK/YiaL family protein [Chloroflexi bacterium]|nr:YhcH/YjgK/YiaL family protein [Chloroflexota bacterium]